MTIKCSVFIALSLDGFIARKDGNIDWLTYTGHGNGNEDYGYRDFFGTIDTLVMGRSTYELALTFKEWPYTGKRVVVLSSGYPQIPDSLSGSVEIMSGLPTDIVERLSESGARHVYVDGGKTIQGFLEAGLIQEMTLTRIPVLIGDGIPLFGKLGRDIRFQHVETKAYQNGYVQSKYRTISTARSA
jgi:dihydrofolate reductase